MKRVVVVGGSLAGLRAAQAVRDHGHDGVLTIIGAEPHRPYSRPPLSKGLLTSGMEFDQLALEGRDYALDAEWRLGCQATRLDLVRRRVGLDTGEEVSFDGVIIATGAQPRRPEESWAIQGVETLRSIDDARRIRDAIAASCRVLIVGAGFLGTEVASACRTLGVEVTVIEAAHYVLAPLGAQAGQVCAEIMCAAGVDLRLNTTLTGVSSYAGKLEAARLADGSRVSADLIVFAVGTKPAVDWLSSSGVSCRGGIRCDAAGLVLGTTGVVAAGDVARWDHFLTPEAPRTEHWSTAAEQGAWAGRRLLDADVGPLRHVPSFWSDQFGIRIQVAGFPGVAESSLVASGSLKSQRFIQLFTRRRRLVGAVAFDMPRALARARRLIDDQAMLTQPALAWGLD